MQKIVTLLPLFALLGCSPSVPSEADATHHLENALSACKIIQVASAKKVNGRPLQEGSNSPYLLEIDAKFKIVMPQEISSLVSQASTLVKQQALLKKELDALEQQLKHKYHDEGPGVLTNIEGRKELRASPAWDKNLELAAVIDKLDGEVWTTVTGSCDTSSKLAADVIDKILVLRSTSAMRKALAAEAEHDFGLRIVMVKTENGWQGAN